MDKTYKTISYVVGAVLIVGFLWVNFSASGRGTLVPSSATFNSMATSGAMTVIGDVQIVATTSKRATAIICNDSGNVAYISLNSDIPMTGVEGIRLNANGGCYEINADNLYTGAIRGTSTVTSLLTVTEGEY